MSGWFPIALALILSLAGGNAQSRSGRPADVKAAYLLVIARYVTWPPGADAGGPLVIGVMNDNEIARSLRTQAARRTVNGRQVEVRTGVTSGDDELDVLFIGKSAAVPADLKSRPVLTASDQSGFLESGGTVEFFRQGRSLRFGINVDAIKAARLKINSKVIDSAYKTIRDGQTRSRR